MNQPSAIRLLGYYRGRPAGSIIPVGPGGLTFGAAEVLVIYRRVAEWADGEIGTPFGSPLPVPQTEHLPAKADVLPTPIARGKFRK